MQSATTEAPIAKETRNSDRIMWNPSDSDTGTEAPLALVGPGHGIDRGPIPTLGGGRRWGGSLSVRIWVPVFAALATVEIQPARRIAFPDCLSGVFLRFFSNR